MNGTTQVNIPKNTPSKFFNDFPSFLIKFILLIVTNEKVIIAIGSNINDTIDMLESTLSIVSYNPW